MPTKPSGVTARALLENRPEPTRIGCLLCWIGLHAWCDTQNRYVLADMTQTHLQLRLDVVYLRKTCSRCGRRGCMVGAAVYVTGPWSDSQPERPAFFIDML